MNEMKKITEELLQKYKTAFESKGFKEVVKDTSSENGTFEVIISTEDFDRAGESIKLDGWDLKNFKSNPVVLWGHSHSQLPVGVATSVTKKDGKLIAKGNFASHAFAQEVRGLYDMGILNATSVGFIPKEYDEAGTTITKAELLEFSFVSVPMNPNALSLLSSSELSIDSLVAKGMFDIKTSEPVETEKDDEPVEEPVEEEKEEVEEVAEEEENEPDDAVEEAVEGNDEEEVEEKEEEEQEEEEKDASKLISSINELTVALADFVTSQGVHKDSPKGDEADFLKFKEDRKALQSASKAIDEVLAGFRKAYEENRK